jgi:hypothetical protein
MNGNPKPEMPSNPSGWTPQQQAAWSKHGQAILDGVHGHEFSPEQLIGLFSNPSFATPQKKPKPAFPTGVTAAKRPPVISSPCCLCSALVAYKPVFSEYEKVFVPEKVLKSFEGKTLCRACQSRETEKYVKPAQELTLEIRALRPSYSYEVNPKPAGSDLPDWIIAFGFGLLALAGLLTGLVTHVFSKGLFLAAVVLAVPAAKAAQAESSNRDYQNRNYAKWKEDTERYETQRRNLEQRRTALLKTVPESLRHRGLSVLT